MAVATSQILSAPHHGAHGARISGAMNIPARTAMASSLYSCAVPNSTAFNLSMIALLDSIKYLCDHAVTASHRGSVAPCRCVIRCLYYDAVPGVLGTLDVHGGNPD